MKKLSADEFIQLIQSVFPHFPEDRQLGILVDIPRNAEKDNQGWRLRRKIAQQWHFSLKENLGKLPFEGVKLFAYPDVGSNNAELPETAFAIPDRLPRTAKSLLKKGIPIAFHTVFKECQLLIAPTEFSTTAPLKNMAKIFGFRAATMPGFSPDMIPALRIDYQEVYRRVNILKEKLDPAAWAKVIFLVGGQKDCQIFFDLRFRKAHLSSGRFPEKGTAGNVPSGETYIVPYEGEFGKKSMTKGVLPVQLGEELVFYRVRENRAIEVEGESGIPEGQFLNQERKHLKLEPAYGNIAELGFGVLGDFGLSPINEILLDEKLGLHVAFGRSDHFGGSVGPGNFSSPQEVIHLDRVYINSLQPRILVKSVILGDESGRSETIMKAGKYLVF